jgi:Icc-related predicted phosphoesterase
VTAVRIAAVGDIHLGAGDAGSFRPCLDELDDVAALLLAGDLTRRGTEEEAAVVAGELDDLAVPVVAVLGNHDVHSDRQAAVVAILEDGGVTVLDGTTTTVTSPAGPVTIAGAKGFGVGFPGASASCFGEPVMKELVRVAEDEAARLDDALRAAPADAVARIALTHYAPAAGTLRGEPPEIHAFLGSYLLGEVIDAHQVDLAVHGHAHRGTERAMTPGGVPVRNVAWPVTGRPFVVYPIEVRHGGRDPGGARA